MRVTDIFKEKERTYSFEFFPPRDEISAVDFGINVGQLLGLDPSFVTVTYGAGGSTRDRTFALVEYLNNRIGIPTVAHYTCVQADREKIVRDLSWLQQTGIENLFVLRGDPPKGEATFVPAEGGFQYASQLTSFVREQFDFCLGGAAYPDIHPEAPNAFSDVLNLKKKVDAGLDFLTTQLFFDNQKYFDLVRRARAAGIACRIIPGIIPLTQFSQLERFTRMSQASIPEALTELTERFKDQPSKLYQAGMDYAIAQCRELLEQGAPGLHFYTLNKSRATIEIYQTLLG